MATAGFKEAKGEASGFCKLLWRQHNASAVTWKEMFIQTQAVAVLSVCSDKPGRRTMR